MPMAPNLPTSRYWLLEGGAPIGPVDAPTIRTWFSQGRITPVTGSNKTSVACVFPGFRMLFPQSEEVVWPQNVRLSQKSEVCEIIAGDYFGTIQAPDSCEQPVFLGVF